MSTSTVTEARPWQDGDLDVIVGEKKLKIESVWVLDPEDL